ncbi:tyrosine-type recombinase/integrase [Methylobacterium iners]|uniref:tyrosine-type recombinase/integrase n=1 Tax=Methylobacterium iners TaxID=418707 RepID=UPI0027954F63|nr:site-specific integrase [Methylobacterium iners]
MATAVEAGRYADGGNLYFSISPNGGRRWVFLFRWRGKPTEMGLGSTRDVTLARAREKAAAARALVAEGLNPMEAREQQRAIPTFGQAADALIADMEPSWRNPKHVAQWKMTLTEYAGPIRSKSVDAVSTDDVLRLLRPIWQAKPETAARVRGRVEAVLDAARAQGHRSGENPARWRGHLDKLLPPRKVLARGHHAAMPYADVPAFVARLRDNPTISNRALEFTILTAGRSGEIMGATWPEIDVAKRLWSIPAERMKGSRPHQVPLTDRMIEILEEMRERGGIFIFPGAKPDKPLSVMALTMAMRRADAGQFTPHGFRSAFRDWCGDETEFPRDVAEAALAHALRDATEAAYRRATALEKRRALMIAWNAYVAAEPASNVIPLRASQNA